MKPPRARRPAASSASGGFTLIELLVVITIILLISAVALPTVIPAINHRQVSEAARIVQGALAGARDVAIHTGAPSGVRFLPDPTFLSTIPLINPGTGQQNLNGGRLDPTAPLASNRMLPLQPAPDYTSGRVSIIKDFVAPFISGYAPPFPGPGISNYPYPFQGGSPGSVLMIEECPIDPSTGLPNEPTSWFWNVRVGDKITVGSAGHVYTVIGPMTVLPQNGNVDLLVNDNQVAGSAPSLQRSYFNRIANQYQTYNVEYLFLVDGLDDNLDGFVDNIWNGVDDNANGQIDEGPLEFVEAEVWQGSLGNAPLIPTTQLSGFAAGYQPTGYLNLPYTIARRPVPGSNGKEIALPANVVIDFTTWGNGPNLERSRVPALAFDSYNGFVDILVQPNGQLVPSTYYSSPASMGLSSNFIHLWLAERGDVAAPNFTTFPTLPIGTIQRVPGVVNTPYPGPVIKGEYRLVSFFSRTGHITTNGDVFFDNPNAPQNGASYNPNIPYLAVQQGISGGF